MIALLPRDMKAALNANIGQTLQIPADLTINLDPPPDNDVGNNNGVGDGNDHPWTVTLPAGESVFLGTSMSITSNITLTASVKGDVETTTTKNVICGEQALITLNPEPIYFITEIDIPYTLENTGTMDTEFDATFTLTSDAQTQSQHLFIPQGETTQGVITFITTVGTHTLTYRSPFEEVTTQINLLSSPEFIITDITPADGNFTLGEVVTFTFQVKNIGGSEGMADLTFSIQDYQDTNGTVILPGESRNLSFTPMIPDDLEEGTYKGICEIQGNLTEFSFYVQGVKIAVNAFLDKAVYEEGDTAILTLDITNECPYDLSLYVRVHLDGFEEILPFNLTDTKTLQSNVPASFNGDKLFFGIYQSTGRGLYLNALYLYKQEEVTVYTENQVYSMGDQVSVIVNTTKEGTLNLTAPGLSTSIQLNGSTTVDFTLPELRSGTYYINSTFENESNLIPFDVIGYSARILSCDLDKELYDPTDAASVTLVVEVNQDISGELRVWMYDSDNRLSTNLTLDHDFQEGENVLEFSAAFSTNLSGIHRLVCGIYAHSVPILLASGTEYFDVKDVIPPYLEVMYPNGGEIVTAPISMYWIWKDNYDENLAITIEYSDDQGSSWINIETGIDNYGSYLWDTTTIPNGINYLVRVTAADDAGNTISDTSDGTFTIEIPPPPVDTSPPEVFIESLMDGARVNMTEETLSIEGSSSDDNEVIKVQVKIDEGEWEDAIGTTFWIFTWELADVSAGSHTISVRAYDGTIYSEIKTIKIELSEEQKEKKDDDGFSMFLPLLILVIILIVGVLIFFRDQIEAMIVPKDEESEKEGTEEKQTIDEETGELEGSEQGEPGNVEEPQNGEGDDRETTGTEEAGGSGAGEEEEIADVD